jgi:hypothetical protein
VIALVPTLRRLLAVLFVAGVCGLLGPAPGATAAAPCTCSAAGSAPGTTAETGTVQDHVKAASAVFTGTVEGISSPGGNAENGFSRTRTVRVDTVYKPKQYELITTETVEVMTDRAFADCAGAELVQDESYVFFVESDEGLTATGCGGTERATARLITQVERLLGEGRAPVPPEPTTATLTRVNPDEPASVTRLAAPGLALVIIGLLGLAVVRRLARPRP